MELVCNFGMLVFFVKLFCSVVEVMDVDVLIVWYEGCVVVSVLSLYFGGMVYFYWGGGMVVVCGLWVNDWMYYVLMNYVCVCGCLWFDFGWLKIGIGVVVFKKNWGFMFEL